MYQGLTASSTAIVHKRVFLCDVSAVWYSNLYIIQFSAFPDQSQSKTQAEAGWIIRNHKNIIYIILSIYSTNLACILFFYLELCHIPDHIPSHQHTIGSPAYCFKLTTTVMTTRIRQDHRWLMDSTKSSSQRRVNLATWDMESNIPDNLETEKEMGIL